MPTHAICVAAIVVNFISFWPKWMKKFVPAVLPKRKQLNFSNVVVMRLNANDTERKFVIGEPSQAYTDYREAEGATNGGVWTSRSQKWNCLSRDLDSVES